MERPQRAGRPRAGRGVRRRPAATAGTNRRTRSRGPKAAMTVAAAARGPGVFLDSDGTLVEDVGYLDTLARLAVFPWTIDAIRALNRAGLPVVVITNQSGIARGYFTEAFVDE